ncbi:MAG: hypothetical protein DMF84_09890 [Acidobacteria bacterium]|nr:MAG: hypothetical protein DMF84_09890 [Acidobacteriota bacterium]
MRVDRALHEIWTWIAPDAAWLVLDPAHSGSITSALQLFGNATFWLFWENGYHALRATGNYEARSSQASPVWQDVNSNGTSEPGEIRPLAAAGIVALSVSDEPSSDPDVAAWAPRGVQLKNGRWNATWDLVLHNIASISTPTTASTDIATRVHDVMRLMPSSRSSGYACPSCGDIR